MKHKILSLSIFMILLLCLTAQLTFSQDSSSHRRWGISASFQGSQVDLLLPVWLNARTVIAPAFGVTWAEDAGTDLHVGLAPRIYLYHEGNVNPFIGLKVAMLWAKPSSGDGTTDWLAGLAFGGEYFFDEHMSMGVESQLNFAFSGDRSLRFGNPGKTSMNTAAALFATVYF